MPMPQPLQNPFSQGPGGIQSPVPGAASALGGAPTGNVQMGPVRIKQSPTPSPAPSISGGMSPEESAALAMSPEEVNALKTPVGAMGDTGTANPDAANGPVHDAHLNDLKNTVGFVFGKIRDGKEDGQLEVKEGGKWRPISEGERKAYESIQNTIQGAGMAVGGATLPPVVGTVTGSIVGDGLVKLMKYANGLKDDDQRDALHRIIGDVGQGVAAEVVGRGVGLAAGGVGAVAGKLAGEGAGPAGPGAGITPSPEGSARQQTAQSIGAPIKPEQVTGLNTPEGQTLAGQGQALVTGNNIAVTPEDQKFGLKIQSDGEAKAYQAIQAIKDEHPALFVPKTNDEGLVKDQNGDLNMVRSSEFPRRDVRATPVDYADSWMESMKGKISATTRRILEKNGNAQIVNPTPVLAEIQDAMRSKGLLDPKGDVNYDRLKNSGQDAYDLYHLYDDIRSKVDRSNTQEAGQGLNKSSNLLSRPQSLFDNAESPASTHVQEPLATTSAPPTFAQSLGSGRQETLRGSIPTNADISMQKTSAGGALSLGGQERTDTGIQPSLPGQTLNPHAVGGRAVTESERNLPPNAAGAREANLTLRDMVQLTKKVQDLAEFQKKNRDRFPEYGMWGKLSHEITVIKNNAVVEAMKDKDPALAHQLLTLNKTFSRSADLSQTVGDTLAKDPKSFGDLMMKLPDDQFEGVVKWLPEPERENLFNGVLQHIVDQAHSPENKDMLVAPALNASTFKSAVNEPKNAEKLKLMLGKNYGKFQELLNLMEAQAKTHYLPGEVASSNLAIRIASRLKSAGLRGMIPIAKELATGKKELSDYYSAFAEVNPGMSTPHVTTGRGTLSGAWADSTSKNVGQAAGRMGTAYLLGR